MGTRKGDRSPERVVREEPALQCTPYKSAPESQPSPVATAADHVHG